MEHKLFRVIMIISCIIIIPILVLYNYYIITEPTEIYIRFIIKPIPIGILIIDILIYFIIYEIHTYALLMLMSLLFCMIGDLLLMFYIPSIHKYDNPSFLIIGGASFLIARSVMSMAFIIYPYRNRCKKTMLISFKKFAIMGVIPFVYTLYIIIYFSVHISDAVMAAISSIYMTIAGIQLYLSLIRIRGYNEESIYSQILAVLGTLLFNIADTLLFWGIFIKPILYSNVVSIILYWIGMTLLTSSVVRSSTFTNEKNRIILNY